MTRIAAIIGGHQLSVNACFGSVVFIPLAGNVLRSVLPFRLMQGMLPSKGKKKSRKVEEDLGPLKEMSEMMVTWLQTETASGTVNRP